MMHKEGFGVSGLDIDNELITKVHLTFEKHLGKKRIRINCD
jgi:hypothetical protein